MTWDCQTNVWKSVNLIARKTAANKDEMDMHVQPLLPNLISIKSLRLHPGAFKQSFPYMIIVDKQDKISIRKFEIVEGYSPPINLDEQKPGI